jgi:NCS2 family nucleobase:cation symporter-2
MSLEANPTPAPDAEASVEPPPRTRHPVDEVLPIPRLLIFGLQHLFIMYAGAVAVPLIVGPAIGLGSRDIAILVSADLLVSGIATVIQSAGISRVLGVRLPVVAGATFTVLNPMIIIATQYGGRNGLPYVYGAMLVSGVFGLVLARPFSRVIRFFPPLVTGTTICIIGLSLGGADISLIASKTVDGAYVVSPSRMALAALVLVAILVISRAFRGFVGQIAVLLSIVIGTVVAGLMHLDNFGNVGTVGWFGAPHIFYFGSPKFAAAPVITMCIVMVVTFTESTADMLAVGEMTGKDLSPGDLARGLAADGLSAFLASFTNSFPDTAFAENVGLVGLTKVRSRWVVTTCGVFLLVLGLIPKVGQVIADLPGPVIGGAATVMFAMVTAVGIQTLHKVNFTGNHNLLIVAAALAVGLLPAFDSSIYDEFPKDFQVIFGSSITATVIVVFVLNLVFNHWVRDGHPAETAESAESAEAGDSVVASHSIAVQEALTGGAVALDVPESAPAPAKE